MVVASTYRHTELECPHCGTDTTDFPNHLLRCPDKPITDRRVHNATDRLIQQGTQYLQSRDIVQELGKDPTQVSQGKLTNIGQALSSRDDLEKWSRSGSSQRWQVVK